MLRVTHMTRGVGLNGTLTANTQVTYNDALIAGTMPTSIEVQRDQYGSDLGLVSQTYYDAFGRAVESQQGSTDVIQTTTTYDGLGRVYQRSNPERSTASATDGSTTTTYDALGRALTVTQPDSSQVQYSYGTSSGSTGTFRTTRITDEAGVQRTMQYDALGRLAGVSEAVDTVSYAYDPLDDLTDVYQTDSATGFTQHRHFTYDSLKRLKQAINPESGTISYTYDANGNLLTKVDGRFTTCYGSMSGSQCDGLGYDSLNRVTHISFSDPNTPSVRFCYDGFQYQANTGTCATTGQASGQWLRKSAVANWTTSNGTITDVSVSTYSYDIAGRLNASSQATAGSQPYPFTYTYYNDDALARIEYPSSRTVTSCYDHNGRVTWVDPTLSPASCSGGSGASSQAYATATAYWPQGAVQTLNLGYNTSTATPSLIETSTYNNRLQITQMTAAAGAATRLALGFGYTPESGSGAGNNGNLGWQTIAYPANGTETALNVTQTYCYDGVNRLLGFTEGTAAQTNCPTGAVAQSYEYDGFGNRWVPSSTQALNVLTPTSQQTWFGLTPTNQIQGIGYDGSGNQIQVNPFVATYDAENRMTEVHESSPVNETYTYTYDGEGRRVQKTANGVTTTYVHDGFGNLAAEYGEAVSAAGRQYLTVDHLGSTRLITDAQGNVVHRYDYLPFGEGLDAGVDGRSTYYSVGAFPDSPSDGLSVKFTSKERDSETGLDYFGKRYYGSSMGRFITTDPVVITTERLMNPQQLNLYAYVANNPLRFIDPTGEILQCVGDAESQKQCFSDLQQIAGEAANRLSMDAKTGVVSFDTKDLELGKNAGAALVNDLVGSKNTYDFSVGPTIMTDKGPVRIDKISTNMANLPTFGDQPKIGNPPSGVSDILGLNLNNPNMTRVSNTNLKVSPEWTVAFHELAEAYEKIDGGKGGSYAAGHNAALQRELELRDQRPYLKEYNTGAGGPADSPNPQGGIIIRK